MCVTNLQLMNDLIQTRLNTELLFEYVTKPMTINGPVTRYKTHRSAYLLHKVPDPKHMAPRSDTKGPNPCQAVSGFELDTQYGNPLSGSQALHFPSYTTSYQVKHSLLYFTQEVLHLLLSNGFNMKSVFLLIKLHTFQAIQALIEANTISITSLEELHILSHLVSRWKSTSDS